MFALVKGLILKLPVLPFLWCQTLMFFVLSSLKQQKFIIPHSFWGQESGCILAQWSWLKVPHKFAFRLVGQDCSHLKAQLGRDNSLPNSVTWLSAVLTSPWLLAGGSVTHLVGPSIVLFTARQLASPGAEGPWEKDTSPLFRLLYLFFFYALFLIHFLLLWFFKIYFIFGCVGSSLLLAGFL